MLIEQKVSFPNGGTDAAPGVIVMVIDDLLGENVDPELEGALVVFNRRRMPSPQTVDALEGRSFALTPARWRMIGPVVKTTTWDAKTGTVTVPPARWRSSWTSRTSTRRSSRCRTRRW